MNCKSFPVISVLPIFFSVQADGALGTAPKQSPNSVLWDK